MIALGGQRRGRCRMRCGTGAAPRSSATTCSFSSRAPTCSACARICSISQGPWIGVGEAGIVLDVGGDHQLSARLEAGEQQRLQHRARGVDRGGVAGGAGADDDETFGAAVGTGQANLSRFGDARLRRAGETGESAALYGRQALPAIRERSESGGAACNRRRNVASWAIRRFECSLALRARFAFRPQSQDRRGARSASSERIEIVVADTNDPADSLRQQNPLGKIPALILENGEAIFDSRVIVEYLDWLAGGGELDPTARRRGSRR